MGQSLRREVEKLVTFSKYIQFVSRTCGHTKQLHPRLPTGCLGIAQSRSHTYDVTAKDIFSTLRRGSQTTLPVSSRRLVDWYRNLVSSLKVDNAKYALLQLLVTANHLRHGISYALYEYFSCLLRHGSAHAHMQ